MSKKLTLIGIVLVFLSNTDAFFTNDLCNVFNYMNPFSSSPSTAMRGIGDGSLKEKSMNFNEEYHLHDIQDGSSLQKAILKIRLKSAKLFIKARNDFLKYIEEKKWIINETILAQKRKDVEIAENDVKIIEDALNNPGQFKDMILGQE